MIESLPRHLVWILDGVWLLSCATLLVAVASPILPPLPASHDQAAR